MPARRAAAKGVRRDVLRYGVDGRETPDDGASACARPVLCSSAGNAGDEARRPANDEVITVMKHIPIFAIVALAGLLGACGDSGSGSNQGSASGVAPASTAAAPAAAATPETAPAAAPAAPAPAVAAADGDEHGKSVFNKTCALCHAAGVAGAPMPGNKEEWAPRIAQGKDVLYKHAMEGFTGQKGMMPPRGGNPALTDEDIKAAVDYMVGKSS